MHAIHVGMPNAITAAALEAGVRRVVLISAISARGNVATDYAISKLAGEETLRSSSIGWTILRPSLEYGDGSYGGTSLVRGLAGLIERKTRGRYAGSLQMRFTLISLSIYSLSGSVYRTNANNLPRNYL